MQIQISLVWVLEQWCHYDGTHLSEILRLNPKAYMFSQISIIMIPYEEKGLGYLL